jgi:hypothetical protein
MARAGPRTTRAGSAPARWLRLDRKTTEADGLTLEFEATAEVDGHGQHPAQLGELLAAGDLVRIRIRLDGPSEVTIEAQTSLGGGLGTPAAEVNSLGPPEDTALPPPVEGPPDREVNITLPLSPASVGPKKEEEQPEERQVAITQELAPLGDDFGGEGGKPPPPEPPPVGEQGVMLAQVAPRARGGPRPCRLCHQLGHYARNCPGILAALPPLADPRLAELRDQIAGGKYQAFATLRKAVVR